MTLPDYEIERLARAGMIDPYDPRQLQPASYDVRLGHRFQGLSPARRRSIDIGDPESYRNLMTEIRPNPNGSVTIEPGEFMLGCTVERVHVPDNISMHIEGKSSIGRLGLVVHATAGYVDPGFRGVLTLELMNWLSVPIILRPGCLIAQVSAHRMEGPARTPYDGRYQDDDGPSASRY